MQSANQFVVESNIPAADPSVDQRKGLTRKQQREREDITAWMELQEEAELELIAAELTASNRRAGRRHTYD